MRISFTSRLRSATTLVAATLVFAAFQIPGGAQADTKPLDESNPDTPVTVAADALPTVQINGVAWSQTIIGNTVYVAGSFTNARPAGAAAGVNTTARSNLLAYDIRTGNLITSWAPTTDAQVLTITTSPDKSRIYIGGDFTSVNGTNRYRIAALNPTTGALLSWAPRSDAKVRAIAATNDTVYFGGLTSSVNAGIGGTARTRVGAVRASDGALLSWAPNLQGGSLHSLAISPDKTKVLLGGSFTTVNGSSNPGYGLAAVDPASGALLPWAGNSLIRNGGANAAITNMRTQGNSVYVNGFVFGSGGNLEGVSKMNWDTGAIEWVEDCHGDTYDTFPKGDVLYVVSHAHYCGNVPNGFQQTEPTWTQHYGTAFTTATRGTLGDVTLGYYNYGGTPSPRLLNWIPQLLNGSFTGQGQAGWSVTGNDDYLSYGGEFPRAGNVAQQGLVRFAVRDKAPNKVGPEFTQSKFNPKVTSLASGTARISWQANWDRDNENLTYQVIRNGNTAQPVYQTTLGSAEWNRPAMGFIDTGLVPGQEYRYRVFAKDAWGNEARSDTVTVTVSSDGSLSKYSKDVLDDGASNYWRLGESSGSDVLDWAGFNDATAGSGVTRGADGAVIDDTNKSSTFNGTSDGVASSKTAEVAPNTFTTETWIKTTSTSGGKILGFGGSQTGSSGSYDRHVYMSNDGRITFGAYPNAVRTVTSAASYNDGQWHHVVTQMGAAGMSLYVDGKKVGGRADTTSGQAFSGYWRIGGDNIGGWPNTGSSDYLNGQIDDVAIYPTVLPVAKIRQHYVDSGRTFVGAAAPADAYGAAVYNDEPDLFWRLGETSGSDAVDSSPNGNAGEYNAGVTKGGQSGIGANGDSSGGFDGSTGVVAAKGTVSNPTTYSQELWFKTTTARGGKLIGLGNQRFGNSDNYDRHVYMTNAGKLVFGTYTGQTNTATSPDSYNDGRWHYMVATQGSDGMKLYVDGADVADNEQTGAQDFSGYWRVGGDSQWGPADSNYFDGSIDEVAVYSKVLTPAQVTDHFTKGGGEIPNQSPTAAITIADQDGLNVAVSGSTSTDPDGTIASYSWDFGDGSPLQSGATASRRYTTSGDHTVTLTVTDDDGATKTTQSTLTLSNNAPTAAFTSSTDELTATFNSSGSGDTDGTLDGYLWEFGDGTTSTQSNPTHSYVSAGTRSVTLTVTDNAGGTKVVSHDVTVSANQAPDAGFSSSTSGLTAAFTDASTDPDGTIASRLWDFGDGATSTETNPTHPYSTGDTYTVKLTVTDNQGATNTQEHDVIVAAPTGPLAVDGFGRTASNGWGSADTGGEWTRTGTASLFSVANGVGSITMASAGAGPRISLNSVSSTDNDATVKVALDKIANGGGAFASLGARVVGTNDYRAKVKVASNGRVTLYLTRVVANAETSLGSVDLPASLVYAVGDQLQIRVRASGTGTTALQAKVWKVGTTEPTTWQLERTDTTDALQVPGGIGLITYLSGSTTNAPVKAFFDDLLVKGAN